MRSFLRSFLLSSPASLPRQWQQVGFHGIIIVGAPVSPPFHIIIKPAAVKTKKGRMGTNNWVMNWSGMDDAREAKNLGMRALIHTRLGSHGYPSISFPIQRCRDVKVIGVKRG